MAFFKYFTQTEINDLTNFRNGETKIGERVATIKNSNEINQELKQFKGKYVLLGIPEDIGVRANLGIGGADTLFLPTLKAFLNMQHSPFLNGEEVLLLGHFDFNEWMGKSKDYKKEELYDLVTKIDDLVTPVIEQIISAKKTPIIIGGGHNNAYPIIKACSKSLNSEIQVINIDAHADFRQMEGRHSGNGFRYAMNEGFLSKYFPFGLHKYFNKPDLLTEFELINKIFPVYFDDLLLKNNSNEKFSEVLNQIKTVFWGLELDLDCIENILSSALTPSGFNFNQIRAMILKAKDFNPLYFHISEGIFKRNDGLISYSNPKLVAYLIADFISIE